MPIHRSTEPQDLRPSAAFDRLLDRWTGRRRATRDGIFALTAVAFIAAALALGLGWVVATSQSHDLYFMPGPLGRAAAPRAAGRSLDRSYGGSELNDRSTDILLQRSTGFRTRSFSGLGTADEIAWGKHNGLTEALPFSHHLDAVFPPQLFKSHPEFFPLVGDKRFDPINRIAFWQPDLGRDDVARYAAGQATQFFATHPEANTFSLGVNDGLLFGESPEMIAILRDHFHGRAVERKPRLAGSDRSSDSRSTDRQSANRSTVRPFDGPSSTTYFRDRPDFSPLVFTFMNRAAADLARTYPDKYLGCLAYYWCENAPPFAVDPHVIPFVTADRAQGYDPAFVREEFDLQSRWARALGAAPGSGRPFDLKPRLPDSANRSTDRPFDRSTDQPLDRSTVRPFDRPTASAPQAPRLGLYDYFDGFGFLVPRVPIHAFAETIRHAYETGFTDYYAELYPNWALDGPLPWVIAQLLQNPAQDPDRLLAIYYANYFQDAAAPMRQFFDRCEQQWMRQSPPVYWLKQYRNESQAALFPTSVCQKLRGLLEVAAAKANSDIVRQRVAFVADAFGVTERFVAFCEARTALTSAVLHVAPSTTISPLLAEYLDKRSAFIRYTHQLTDRQPLAFWPISYHDWLADDPTFAATFAIAGADQGNRPISSDTPPDFIPSAPQPVSAAAATAAQTPTSETPAADPLFDRSTVRPAVPHFSISAFQRFSVSKELLSHPTFDGPIQPGARIAGLQYGIDLPPPWRSTVEPNERFRSEIRTAAAGGKPVLRLTGSLAATVSQRVSIHPGHRYVASARVRAHVRATGIVLLSLGWLDANQRHVGTSVAMRLPEGNWSDWVTLRQAAAAPVGAVAAEMTVAVKRQFDSDWAELGDFSLGEIAE